MSITENYRSSALAAIKQILKDLSHDESVLEQITEETPLQDFVDSLDRIELSSAMEAKLSGKITDYVVESWQTFGDVVTTYLDIE